MFTRVIFNLTGYSLKVVQPFKLENNILALLEVSGDKFKGPASLAGKNGILSYKP